MSTKTHKEGPFTWVYRPPTPDYRDQSWELQRPDGMTYFCLKDYGGKPTDKTGFSGWRLVSGGPFTDAGGWESFEEAVVGVTPYLIKHYEEAALQKIAEGEKMIAMCRGMIEMVRAVSIKAVPA